jgi:chromosomal replication initiation ATPase DnaA
MTYEDRRDDLMRKLWSRNQASIASLSVKFVLPQSVVGQIVAGVGFVKPKAIEQEAQQETIKTMQIKCAKIPDKHKIILRTVAKFFKQTTEDLRSNKRRKDIVFARHVALLMLREFTSLSTPQIGKFMGRDHATIIYGRNIIIKLIAEGKVPEIYELRRLIINSLDKEQPMKIAA